MDGFRGQNLNHTDGIPPDTVKNGGKYDGALGVVTGVAALGYLKQSGFVPKHSLEVGGLMEEEGSRFPSGCQEPRNLWHAERRGSRGAQP